MKRFEYKIVTPILFDEENALNELGKEGWELVSVIFHNPPVIVQFYLKREIKQ